MDSQTAVPHCSLEPQRTAVAWCTDCLAPFSAAHLGYREDGRAICNECSRYARIPVTPFVGGVSERDPALAQGWLQAIVNLMLRPHVAFGNDWKGSVRGAFIFGYTATVIGFLATTAWNMTFNAEALIAFTMETSEQAAQLGEELIARILWFGTPFVALVRLFLGALLFHLGVRLLAAQEPVPFRTSLRAFSLASGTLVLCIIPKIGPLLALMTWFSASLAYLHVTYRLRTLRGLMVLLPSFLTITALGPSTFVPPT